MFSETEKLALNVPVKGERVCSQATDDWQQFVLAAIYGCSTWHRTYIYDGKVGSESTRLLQKVRSMQEVLRTLRVAFILSSFILFHFLHISLVNKLSYYFAVITF
jgi:hypothetical protein